MLTGLEQKKKNLQADEKVFLKLSGINEQIEKAGQDKDDYGAELTEAKDRRDSAKMKKAGAVAQTMSKIAEKMNSVLQYGAAFFSYDEDEDGKRSMRIGWKNGEIETPYNGLSGMEKQVFDAALAHVLDANIIVIEADHMDRQHFEDALKQLAEIDKQVIVNTWRPVVGLEIPDCFKVVEV